MHGYDGAIVSQGTVLGRKDTLIGCFEAGWTVKVIVWVLAVALRRAGLMLEPRSITSHR